MYICSFISVSTTEASLTFPHISRPCFFCSICFIWFQRLVPGRWAMKRSATKRTWSGWPRQNRGELPTKSSGTEHNTRPLWHYFQFHAFKHWTASGIAIPVLGIGFYYNYTQMCKYLCMYICLVSVHIKSSRYYSHW